MPDEVCGPVVGGLDFLNGREGTAAVRPRFFDVLAYGKSYTEVPLISPWRTIRVDPSRAGQWTVAGDLDGDGEAELVSARNNPRRSSQEVVPVIVHKLDGTVLWEWGEPEAGVARLGYDVACQVHDWDGDGSLEVVVVGAREMVELDGATGAEKRRLPNPEDAADCVTFVNLSGGERPTEVLIKTRYVPGQDRRAGGYPRSTPGPGTPIPPACWRQARTPTRTPRGRRTCSAATCRARSANARAACSSRAAASPRSAAAAKRRG